jgi:hypothetical protein
VTDGTFGKKSKVQSLKSKVEHITERAERGGSREVGAWEGNIEQRTASIEHAAGRWHGLGF